MMTDIIEYEINDENVIQITKYYYFTIFVSKYKTKIV